VRHSLYRLKSEKKAISHFLKVHRGICDRLGPFEAARVDRNQKGSIALSEWREASASAIVVHPSLALLLALCGRTDIGRAARPWILKLARTRRWAAERAAIKAEVKRAKETVDLIGIARAVTRLDALEAEIVAVEKTKPANRN
jgi:hypothetical protein